jgi:UDP-N-acetylmuramoyl-L-alanyl-D-glutamate--2,6-diaminopimelate ligase
MFLRRTSSWCAVVRGPAEMRLGVLVRDVGIRDAEGEMDTEISGLALDSREISPGDAFVALRGERLDGRDFIGDAVENGAAAVIYEGEAPSDLSVPSVSVLDGRDALARMAGAFHGRPSEALLLVGVTGTNGKTTTTYLIRSIMRAAGYAVGLLSTIAYEFEVKVYPAPHTTPEAPAFQGLLREMLDAGCTHVVAEVSSHALAQKRVDHAGFQAAVFTNLTREHLDFHGSMGEYFSAKKRLFDELLSGPAVINVDDHYGRELAAAVKGSALTFGIHEEADLRASDVSDTPGGLAFRLHHGGRAYAVESGMLGKVNVYNILAATGVAFALDIGWEHAERGIRDFSGVEGRFQRVQMGQDFLCIVDYAHTEDALERLISNARGVTAGRVITVFGCGGDRDRSKRPAMGAVAAAGSDMVFITSDNPRGEDPVEIIKQIEAGLGGGERGKCSVFPDRGEAIRMAVGAARATDTVLIAGKGHEDYQEIKSVRHGFSDMRAAREAIGEKLEGRL